MRLLNLCSGTKSVSEPFEAAGWECVNVDWDDKHSPTLCLDITTWDYKSLYEPGHFDVVWASPDCTQYSIARTTAKTPRNFERADALVRACVDIIEYLQPRCFFIENPDSGLLKHRCCINYLPYVRVDYCMYGKPYRKRTRIWTNMGDTWRPKLCDRQHLVNGRHEATAQRGRTQRYCHNFSRDQLHRLPEAPCQEIFVQCHVMP